MSGFDDRLAPWFKDRSWRVMSELNGGVSMQGAHVTYDKGAFEIAPPGVYVTPLGSRGRRGYVIIEIGADSQDIPGSARVFGGAALRRANAAYGTISGLPEED
jgi:hypothetical protein